MESKAEKEKWLFLYKLNCPSNAVVICDASEVFGGSEDLDEFEPKRTWEDLELAFAKLTDPKCAQITPECLAVNRVHEVQTLLDQGKYAFVYGRQRNGKFVELRVVLDPFLDSLE